jgi:hypothetical protein
MQRSYSIKIISMLTLEAWIGNTPCMHPMHALPAEKHAPAQLRFVMLPIRLPCASTVVCGAGSALAGAALTWPLKLPRPSS